MAGRKDKRLSKVAQRRKPKRLYIGGTGIITPTGLEQRYGWTPVTRWRAERDKRLPPRDVRIGGRLAGWKPSTIEAAESGQIEITPHTHPDRRFAAKAAVEQTVL